MSEQLVNVKNVIISTTMPLAVVIGEKLTDADLASAVGQAHIIEFRADLYGSKDSSYLLDEADRLSEHRPVLLTVRPKDFGGQFEASDADRLDLFQQLLARVGGVDIELHAPITAEVIQAAHGLGRTAIASVHDYQSTSRGQLDGWLRQARATEADYYKFATCLSHIWELDWLADWTIKNNQQNIITVGMDRFGPLSRIVLPALGSRLVYGFPLEAKPVVSGQISIPELAHFRKKLFVGQSGGDQP